MRRWLGSAILAFVALASVNPAHAQGAAKPVQWYVATGYALSQGDTGVLFDDGWNFAGGAIYRPAPDKHFALRFDLGYSFFSASHALIREAQASDLRVDDGHGSYTTLTAEILYEFGHTGHGVGGYVGVGFGGAHRYGNLTTTVVSGGYWCDPWTGWCYPGYFPGDAVVADTSLTKFDYSVAAGVTFTVGHGDLYLEGRYHWMGSADRSTEVCPIVIGYRF